MYRVANHSGPTSDSECQEKSEDHCSAAYQADQTGGKSPRSLDDSRHHSLSNTNTIVYFSELFLTFSGLFFRVPSTRNHIFRVIFYRVMSSLAGNIIERSTVSSRRGRMGVLAMRQTPYKYWKYKNFAPAALF